MPKELRTLSDHLRKRRIELRLSQRQVEKQMGLGSKTVWSWERGTEPATRSWSEIIRFLGYDPREAAILAA